ncbi:MAG: hypothetical protein OXU86_04465 [Thaumarchaeota archaeon]|nr:hypothetical protein [Nitrososphaerota archaeon]
MEDGEARIIVRHMDDEEERAVGNLLLDAGMDLVAVNTSVSPEGERHNNFGEVDLLFRHGDTAFIVEVSVQRERGDKLKKFCEVFSKTETLDSLKRRCPEISSVKNFKRIYFDRIHNYNKKELDDIMDPIGKENNYIVLKDEFDKIRSWIGSEKKRRVDSFLDIVSRKGNGPISPPGGA